MSERCIQTANDFRSRFEEGLRFRLGYPFNIAAQMIDKLPEFLPHIGGMRPRIF